MSYATASFPTVRSASRLPQYTARHVPIPTTMQLLTPHIAVLARYNAPVALIQATALVA